MTDYGMPTLKRIDCETGKLIDLETLLHIHCAKLRLKWKHYRIPTLKRTDYEIVKLLGSETLLHKYCEKLKQTS